MVTDNFRKFLAKELGFTYETEIVRAKIAHLFTINVRALKPTLFANAIMFWCWFVRPKMWFKKWKTRHHHCAGVEVWRINDTILIAVVYDAQLKYQRTNFKKWVKEYKIMNICDTISTLKIDNKYKRMLVHDKHEELIDTDYGKVTIFGIIVSDTTQTQIIGVDGEDKVICSEAEIYPYIQFLPPLKEPADLIDVIDIYKYHGMKKYNGELNEYY